MAGPRDLLESWIGGEAAQPVAPAVTAIAETIVRRHGAAVAAVLFYGSCLRQPEPRAGDRPVFDFYLIVDSYAAAYRGKLAALANALLPPNVFYLEHPWRDEVLPSKYAVVSLAQFSHGCSRASVHSYFWARFAQPARIVFARDEAARSAVRAALTDAIVTLVARTAPLMEGEFDAATLWISGFRQTYRAELRSESGDRPALIYSADAVRYERFTRPALAVAGFDVGDGLGGRLRLVNSSQAQWLARSRWWGHRTVGKLLSVLRLAKGVFTFDGGLDYILWKIERHSGVKTTITPWQRRHPLLAAPQLAWKLYRRGAFR